MPGYLSADIICFEKRTVFQERSSSKTVGFEEFSLILGYLSGASVEEAGKGIFVIREWSYFFPVKCEMACIFFS